MRTIALIGTKTEETGTDLLAEFEEAVASIAARANDREVVVEERLRTLESEQTTLRALRARIVGPQVTDEEVPAEEIRG